MPNHGERQLVRRESTNAAIRESSFGSDIFQTYLDPSLAEIQRLAVVNDPNGGKSRLPLLQPTSGTATSKATRMYLTVAIALFGTPTPRNRAAFEWHPHRKTAAPASS